MLVGFVEGFEVAEDFFLVRGWINLDIVNGSLTLRILKTGIDIGSTLLTDLFDRDDLTRLEGNCKCFRCFIPLGEKIIAEDLTTCLVTADRRFELPHLNPAQDFSAKGEIELIPDWGISGWLWDPRGRSASIVIDQSAPLNITLSEMRNDLPTTFISDRPNGFKLSYYDLNSLARTYFPNFALLDGDVHVIRLETVDGLVASINFVGNRKYRGKVERFEKGILTGWACSIDGSEDSPLLDVYVGQARYLTVRAHFSRSDIVRMGFVKSGGGFKCVLHQFDERTSDDLTIRVTYHLTGEPVTSSNLIVHQTASRPSKVPNLLDALPSQFPEISIIIPVHNAAEDLQRCLESVVWYTTLSARLIIIDDASTDPRVTSLLRHYAAYSNISIIHGQQNNGFTKTVNRGLAVAGQSDVVLLNSDTIVGPRWLENLYVAAYHRPNVGTVTPLSDNAGAFSVPELGMKNTLPRALGRGDLSRLVCHASSVEYPEVPTGNGFCLYIKRRCIQKIGIFNEMEFPFGYGEENDFCQRTQRNGFVNIVDDRTLVHHVRSASFGEKKAGHYAAGRAKLDRLYPEYNTQIRIFESGPAFLEIRWRIRNRLQKLTAKSDKIRPRFLFVIATQTGGTPQTNRDLMKALEQDYEPYLLRCSSREIFLDRFEKGSDIPLLRYDLRQEIIMSNHTSSEYEGVVGDILARFSIEFVHIRHIAWHSLNLIQLCHRLSIPIVFSFHDFYTVCPNIKLLDENGVYCGGTCTSTAGVCQAELWPPSSVPPLKHRFVGRWRSMFQDVLRFCDAFVTTAESAATILTSAFPDLDLTQKLTIIPHGRSFNEMLRLAALPDPTVPLRVLVPGNISRAKGAAIITDIVNLDQGATVEFHVLGDGGTLKTAPGLVIHGTYERDQVALHIMNIMPHIGAVLSIWPETYCHTLSEMWACGIPVIGFQIGAVGDRLAETGAGWILPIDADARAVLQKLNAIRSKPYESRLQVENTIKWQESVGTRYGVDEMASRYKELYNGVLCQRKPFAISPCRLSEGDRSR